jgi:hypothetical protein
MGCFVKYAGRADERRRGKSGGRERKADISRTVRSISSRGAIGGIDETEISLAKTGGAETSTCPIGGADSAINFSECR